MVIKNVYVTQPYKVGNKDKTSLAIILPSRLVKEHRIDISTILAAKYNTNSNELILRRIDVNEFENKNVPVGQRIAAPSQQASGDQ